MEIITLSNGKKVANFSSPHSFTFEDGSVLPAVSDVDAEHFKVTFIEKIDNDGDVELQFKLSEPIISLINMWMNKYDNNEVDVVFCPLPMITALKEHIHWRHNLKDSPFRAVRIEDRVKKLVSITKQCL